MRRVISLTKRLLSPVGSLDALIEKVAAKERISARLIRRVVELESKGDANAVSPAGAKGLMQLMPPAQRDVHAKTPSGVEWDGGLMLTPFDPESNLVVGARYLRLVAVYLNRSVADPSHWPDIYVGYNIGVGNAPSVFAGKPERAARAIKQQAYGEPDVYYANVIEAFKGA